MKNQVEHMLLSPIDFELLLGRRNYCTTQLRVNGVGMNDLVISRSLRMDILEFKKNDQQIGFEPV